MDIDPHGGEQNLSRLKDLAERLLDHGHHADTDSGQPRLFLGELPRDLPAEIPVPEGMVLLGGLLHRVSPWRDELEAQVVLEAEVGPEGVYEAFRGHLAGSGWVEKRWPSAERGGFVSDGPVPRFLVFCLSPRGPALTVGAYRRGGAGTTEVRLSLEGPRRHSPCSEDHDRHRYEGRSVVPALFPPEGVAQIWGGGGGGSDSEENRAHLRTGMSPAAIVDHYSAQLEGAGWSRACGLLSPNRRGSLQGYRPSLFTGMRGRKILRSSDAGYRIKHVR